MAIGINEYEKGDLVTVKAEFKDSDGVNINPTSVFVQYKDPEGNTTTKQYGVDTGFRRPSTGLYEYDVDANQSGKWHYRWYSTGLGQAADEHSFTVKTSNF
jgi:hypothetical protein